MRQNDVPLEKILDAMELSGVGGQETEWKSDERSILGISPDGKGCGVLPEGCLYEVGIGSVEMEGGTGLANSVYTNHKK